jgi:hypothetical protein
MWVTRFVLYGLGISFHVIAEAPKTCYSRTVWRNALRNLKPKFIESDAKNFLAALACLNWSDKYFGGIICLCVSMVVWNRQYLETLSLIFCNLKFVYSIINLNLVKWIFPTGFQFSFVILIIPAFSQQLIKQYSIKYGTSILTGICVLLSSNWQLCVGRLMRFVVPVSKQKGLGIAAL